VLDYSPLIIAEMEMISKGEQGSLDKVRAIRGSRAKSYEGAGGDSNDARAFLVAGAQFLAGKTDR
jgi:hypothetical protein